MSTALIELKKTSLTLPSLAGNVEILRGIDLTVHEGERVAITGPSGSGKSSLLMVTAGLERATSGQVIVLGSDLTAANEDELARLPRPRRRRIPGFPPDPDDDSRRERTRPA